jgi:hypothetical protein
VGVIDPERLKDMGMSLIAVKVEAGKFTELTIDFDKLRLFKMRPKQ